MRFSPAWERVDGKQMSRLAGQPMNVHNNVVVACGRPSRVKQRGRANPPRRRSARRPRAAAVTKTCCSSSPEHHRPRRRLVGKTRGWSPPFNRMWALASASPSEWPSLGLRRWSLQGPEAGPRRDNGPPNLQRAAKTAQRRTVALMRTPRPVTQMMLVLAFVGLGIATYLTVVR